MGFRGRPKLQKDEVEQLRLQFMQVDANKDGKIDYDEFRNFLKKTFPYAKPSDLDEMTPRKLGDEDIYFDEYVEFMSQDTDLRFDARFIRHEIHLWQDKRGLALYLPFLAFFVYFLVTDKGLGSSYWMQYSVMDSLANDEFENSDDLRYYKAFDDIGEIEEFWQWMSWPMINTLWPSDDAGSTAKAGINSVNYPIGALKLRQYRVRGDVCDGEVNRLLMHNSDMVQPESARRERREAFGFYCFGHAAGSAEDTGDYAVQSTCFENSFGAEQCNSVGLDGSYFVDPWEKDTVHEAYTWKSAADFNGSALSYFFGQVANYPPSGHGLVIPLSTNRSTVLRIFDTLANGITVGGWIDPTTGQTHPPKQVPWIDEATRAIFVELTTYNLNVDLVGKYHLVIEKPPTGLLVPTKNVLTYLFFNINEHGVGYFVLLVLFIVMIGIQCLTWFSGVADTVKRHLLQETGGEMQFFVVLEGLWIAVSTDFWVVFDFVNLSLLVVAWGFRFYWMSIGLPSSSVLTLNSYPDEWDSVGEVVSIIAQLEAINALLIFLRIFYFLRLNSKLNLLTKTIAKAKAELMGIVFIFLIVFIAFALMTHVVFGTVLYGYRDFTPTISSLLRMLLGDFDYTEMRNGRQSFAPILFVVFNVVANFLLLNMVVAVLNQAFASVQEEKYDPAKIKLILETLNSLDTIESEETFAERMYRRQKGCQHWIRGTSVWRETVYACNVFLLYTTSKDELPGGADEWAVRYREAAEYNPRTYWQIQEEMMFYTKRSLSFKDKLRISPMPLRFHLLDEFGDDLRFVVDLTVGSRNSANPAELSQHDFVTAPAYNFGEDPRSLLLKLMDFFHTWKTHYATNYVQVARDDDGTARLEFEQETSEGIAVRGSEEAEDLILKKTLRWLKEWQGDKTPDVDDVDQTQVERLRRQAEKEEFETFNERKQLEDQMWHLNNLQRHLDGMHSSVSGKPHEGVFKVGAKDAVIPTEIIVSNCSQMTVHSAKDESDRAPLENEGATYNLNGTYKRTGILNGKPYWKQVQKDARDEPLHMLWGNGKWVIGLPGKLPWDNVCSPSLLTWEDVDEEFPPKQQMKNSDILVPCAWEPVLDGGIGNPPVLDYMVEEDAQGKALVRKVEVSGATTHQANGTYRLRSEKENGKCCWRKRHQVVIRYFKAEPFEREEEKASCVRRELRRMRDDIATRHNVTLRVPGESAAIDRRVQLEGDWLMCHKALTEILKIVRKVVAQEVFPDTPLDDAENDYFLPEVFMENGVEISERQRQAKVAACTAVDELSEPLEWECSGVGYDIDLCWKNGKWVLAARLAESGKGYVGFHEAPPKVSLLLVIAKDTRAAKQDRHDQWAKFLEGLPGTLARNAGEDHAIGGSGEVHLIVKPRAPQPGVDDGSIKRNFFESQVRWHERNPRAGADAMLFGASIEDDFPDGSSTSQVLLQTGRLKGTWLDCTIADAPEKDAPNQKYRASVDMPTALSKSKLRVHRAYYDEYFGPSAKIRASNIREILVPKSCLRKQEGHTAEAWVSRFVSWIADPAHGIHKEFSGILSATKVLSPEPRSLYQCEDPDTRHHPPLFDCNWTRFDGKVEPDVALTARTRVYVKKRGLGGGIDTEPLYLSLHHAYTKALWRLDGSRSACVYRGAESFDENTPLPEKTSMMKEIGCVVCAEPVQHRASKTWWLQLFNEEGHPYGEWVEKTADWVIHKDGANKAARPLSSRDARDEESLYACVHKWKNEAAVWDLERSPTRGTKMKLRKPGLREQPDADGKGSVILSSNYPLKYKGDRKDRYLSIFDSDLRTGSRTGRPPTVGKSMKRKSTYFAADVEPCSYWASAHENADAPFNDKAQPAAGDAAPDLATSWEIVQYPADVRDIRLRSSPWWQSDACILDWLKHDMRDASGALIGVPAVPSGTKWSALDETSFKGTDWEIAPRHDLRRRVTWFMDHWRVVRRAYRDLDNLDPKDPQAAKLHKHRWTQLAIIDAERERQSHCVLFKKDIPNGLPCYLSVWKNYPVTKLVGMWRTRALLKQGEVEEFILKERDQQLVAYLASDPLEVAWETDKVPEIGGYAVPAKLHVADGKTLDFSVRCVDAELIVANVERWRLAGLEYEFELTRKDDLERDENSHFVLAVETKGCSTHTTWEIEPVQDLDDTIEAAVKQAVDEEAESFENLFRSLINEEMRELLRSSIPNVLLTELGPPQLAQTVNHKIRCEAQNKDETARKTASDLDETVLASQERINALIAEWQTATVSGPDTPATQVLEQTSRPQVLFETSLNEPMPVGSPETVATNPQLAELEFSVPTTVSPLEELHETTLTAEQQQEVQALGHPLVQPANTEGAKLDSPDLTCPQSPQSLQTTPGATETAPEWEV
ncbi:Polycystin-2 [Diplonema papillatum]|nr:Polycystin-2 [Diplonema papillatum]